MLRGDLKFDNIHVELPNPVRFIISAQHLSAQQRFADDCFVFMRFTKPRV